MREWGLTPAAWRDLDEDDRDLILAESELVCSRCGNLRSVCSDRDIDWHPNESVCWPTATQEWAQRLLRDKHENAKPEGDELHPLEGVSVWVSDIDFTPSATTTKEAGDPWPIAP